MTIDPHGRRLRITTLTWEDVDPERHPFDPGACSTSCERWPRRTACRRPIGTTPPAASIALRAIHIGDGSARCPPPSST
ncbi:hypothetical protein [Virgisporangium aliadipatigenens]|uniref:hypothetical protein n=1 Tax=Virgisporangium aliadipatigenens TaxID=741659 RepID=UPI001944718E|nr:hypothetical protein [Virgisporangium aliadipatigenens]